jgi:hypothetical protein
LRHRPVSPRIFHVDDARKKRRLRSVLGSQWIVVDGLGDSLDIAFTIGPKDHPEYGGPEIALRDLKTAGKTTYAAV